MAAAVEHADLVRALTKAAFHEDAIHRAQQNTLRSYYNNKQQQQEHAASPSPARSSAVPGTRTPTSMLNASTLPPSQQSATALVASSSPTTTSFYEAANVGGGSSGGNEDTIEHEQRRAANISTTGYLKKLPNDTDACYFLPSRWDARSDFYSSSHQQQRLSTMGGGKLVGNNNNNNSNATAAATIPINEDFITPIVVQYGVDKDTHELYSTVTQRCTNTRAVASASTLLTAAAAARRSALDTSEKYDYFGDLIEEEDDEDGDDFNSKRSQKARLLAAAPYGDGDEEGMDSPSGGDGGAGLRSPFSEVDVGSMYLASPSSVRDLRRFKAKRASQAFNNNSGAPLADALPPSERRDSSTQQQQEQQQEQQHEQQPKDTNDNFETWFPGGGLCDMRSAKSTKDIKRVMKTLLFVPPTSLPGGNRIQTLDISGIDLGSVGANVLAAEQRRKLQIQNGQQVQEPPPGQAWFGDEADITIDELQFRSEILKLIFPILGTRGPGHLIHHLIADNCNLHDVDMDAIAFLLRHTPTEDRPKVQLVSISVRNNDITDTGVELIKKAVKYNHYIHHIDVSGNPRVENKAGSLEVLRERLSNNRKGISNLSALQRLFS